MTPRLQLFFSSSRSCRNEEREIPVIDCTALASGFREHDSYTESVIDPVINKSLDDTPHPDAVAPSDHLMNRLDFSRYIQKTEVENLYLFDKATKDPGNDKQPGR